MSTDNSKTVLQIIDSLYRGGAQKVVLEIVRALPEFKHIVCYWADDKDLESEFLELNVTLIKLPFDGIHTLPRVISFVRRRISHIELNYVHAHMFIPNIISRLIKGTNTIAISTYHGECFEMTGIKGYVMRLAETVSIGRTDILIAVSNSVRDYIRRKLNFHKPMLVIHNFGQSITENEKTLPKDYRLPLRIVATSNNQPYKNYPLLLEVFSKLQKKQISVDIYGNGMAPLIRYAAEKGIHNLNFKGIATNIPEILKQYDAYIATSNSGEGFSLSMLEAMNAGLPVICSDIPQFLEAVGDAGITLKMGIIRN